MLGGVNLGHFEILRPPRLHWDLESSYVPSESSVRSGYLGVCLRSSDLEILRPPGQHCELETAYVLLDLQTGGATLGSI